MEPTGMFKDPATPLWLKDPRERKPMTFPAQNSASLSHAGFGMLKGESVDTK